MSDYDRRTFMTASGLAVAAALAGCNAPANGDADDDDDGGDGTTAAGTTTGGTTTTGDQAPPGADVLGASGDLQAGASVSAKTLDSDQGAGQFVFTPAVVWLEPGATVEWTLETGSHSVTAYHPDNDGKPRRIPDDAAPFDSGTLAEGETFSHTFETEGVYNYYCRPHVSLGMVGTVVVGGPKGGPGTTEPSKVGGTAASHLTTQLENAGVLGAGGGEDQASAYGWQAATIDSYWYSLYNMSTNIAMSGNGVLFPNPDDSEQVETFQKRIKGITKAADVDRPPVKNPNLNMVPFTSGDPHFTQKPVLSGEDGRPDASTLTWDKTKSSKTVSPASLAWTHLKGITWAKNFENHADILPTQTIAPKFRAQVLSTLAQLGVKFSLVDGRLRLNDQNLALGSAWQPGQGITDEQPRPGQHAAMLWYLADLVSLAQGGWFGYENPRPLIPATNLQQLADGMAKTTFTAFPPQKLVDASSTRHAGLMLGATGWYGTHAGSDQLATMAADYADGLAAQVEANLDGNGRIGGGVPNQAATQGVVGQGLLWASQIDGVDHADTARSVLGYLQDELWDPDAGTYASGTDDDTYRITARDAGDVVGGLNAADELLDLDGVQSSFAEFFDQTFNRGRLQRAERPPSRDESAAHTLPLPPKAGGEFGQAAVSNAAVEYDTGSDEWSVVDSTFDTEAALYLANQEVWLSRWGESFFQGRGVPGRSDTPQG
jgi:plastocyanin